MPEPKEKEGEKSTEGGVDDKALERLGEKLAKAAGSADTSALKEIVQEFYRDAVDLRAKNRELNGQITAIKGKLPKEGEVVLSAEDAKAYAEVQKLGIPLKDLPKKITEGGTAQQELAGYQREKVAEEVAEVAGVNKAVLKAIARTQKLNLVVKSKDDPSGATEKDGKKKQVREAFVIPEGENQQPMPWSEYLDKNLGDFREALSVSEAERNGRQETPTGPRITRQRSGEGGPGKGVTDEALETAVVERLGGALRV